MRPEQARASKLAVVAPQPELALWNTKQVAAHLGCSEVAVRTWRRTGMGPAYIQVTSGQIRYRPAVVEEFLQNRTRSSTSEVIASEVQK